MKRKNYFPEETADLRLKEGFDLRTEVKRDRGNANRVPLAIFQKACYTI